MLLAPWTAPVRAAQGTAPATAPLPGGDPDAPGPWLADDALPLRLLFRPPSSSAAEALKSRAPAALAALGAALGAELPTPFTLRLYATDDAFARDHPLGRLSNGYWAEEHRPRREAAVVVPRTPDGAVDLSALDVAVRYALAHQLLAHASEGRLPGAFQEGIARLFLPPTAATQSGVATLRAAGARGAIVPWSDLAGPGSSYLQPEITYPEGLSIAVQLVEARGFRCLADLAVASASDAPFRDAFARACGVSFETAEAEWRRWLPRYVDGGWRDHPLFRTDLAPARQLLAVGENDRVAALLRAVLAVTPPGAVADEARALLARAEGGADSNRLLATAAAALSAGDYGAAQAAAAAAKDRAADVGADGIAGGATELGARAAAGQRAALDEARASRLPRWRVFEARRAAAAAAAAYARLGNDPAAARSRALLDGLDRRVVPIAWLCLLAGALVLGDAVRRRRRIARPAGGGPAASAAPGRPARRGPRALAERR